MFPLLFPIAWLFFYGLSFAVDIEIFATLFAAIIKNSFRFLSMS
jgi:hypothetical protein